MRTRFPHESPCAWGSSTTYAVGRGQSPHVRASFRSTSVNAHPRRARTIRVIDNGRPRRRLADRGSRSTPAQIPYFSPVSRATRSQVFATGHVRQIFIASAAWSGDVAGRGRRGTRDQGRDDCGRQPAASMCSTLRFPFPQARQYPNSCPAACTAPGGRVTAGGGVVGYCDRMSQNSCRGSHPPARASIDFSRNH
jgi:hypothetical protein